MAVGVAVLGATGSIGRSAARVLDRHRDRFRVVALAAHRDAEGLAELERRFEPRHVALVDREVAAPDGWLRGAGALRDIAGDGEVDIVLNAVVGAAGLEATLAALEAGKRLALANKESLVAGGPLVLEALAGGGGELIPVDSEHSAILQCLRRFDEPVRRLILTASGGAFRDWDVEALAMARPEDALKHPTWDMGAKITVDSATLANKALEVIEAHFLFGLDYDQVDAVVHPQSIIHSMVEYPDGSVLAQMGFPNMELPILYALTHPEHLDDDGTRTFDPVAAGTLEFEPIDMERFPTFALGVEAGRAGGTAPAVFNAANEEAVSAFLDHTTSFAGIPRAIRNALNTVPVAPVDSLDTVMEADRKAREAVRTLVQERS